jgi:hypothetical protein
LAGTIFIICTRFNHSKVLAKGVTAILPAQTYPCQQHRTFDNLSTFSATRSDCCEKLTFVREKRIYATSAPKANAKFPTARTDELYGLKLIKQKTLQAT